MSTAALPIPPLAPAPPPEKTLRQLFLTLFLRGRGARGLKKQTAPKSIGAKLFLTLVFYGFFGLVALFFWGQPIFALSIYLHAMTFVFLGMFVAASSGEILFNKEEADILLHRPVTPRELLRAKIRVLVDVSLWIAGAFNLVGLFVGIASPNGSWLFPVAHAVSTILEALFCTASVVLVYQMCLRWFGRERLDGLMTMAQVLVSIATVLAGQMLPRMVFIAGHVVTIGQNKWIALLPPAWFAGLDDALCGGGAGSWLLAAVALVATVIVLSAAFGKLTHVYGAGLQRLGETATVSSRKAKRRRWIDRLVEMPPLCWWLRDSVQRAAFLLTAAYLLRDRDVKLRIYPGLAPFLVLPILIILPQHRHGGGGAGFVGGVLFLGSYLGLLPMIALAILQYSQQWQAADIFRLTPIPGPARIAQGARRAVFCMLTLPAIIVFGLTILLLQPDVSLLLLLLPGIIAQPVYALIPALTGGWVPLAVPPDEGSSATRGLKMMFGLFSSFALAGIAFFFKYEGLFIWFLIVETCVSAGICFFIQRSLAKVAWQSLE